LNKTTALTYISRTIAFNNIIDFFEDFIRDKHERELYEEELSKQRLYDKRAAGRNITPKSLLGV